MQLNWFIIVPVLILAILLVIYLIRRNQKDEKEVMEHFDEQASIFPDDESEANDPQ